VANQKIDAIEGIGPVYAEKLNGVGIADTDTLLERCGTAKGRSETAEQADIEGKLLLKWVNMADLFRISGIGPQFAELLEASGVDTVKELGTRNAANLAQKLAEVNEQKRLTRSVPSAAVVEKWVKEAETLPPAVSH